MIKGSLFFSICYIVDVYEVESGVAGDKEILYLAGDAYSASSVLVKENGTSNVYHICRDYLGSITHLTDYNGVVLQENSYDAWGRLRNPQTQVLYNDDSQPKLLLDRGYTSHEHLPHFGLINMNARLYSPVLGRFLSPDPYVTMPDFSQNFNRYSYALNNPLKYIDPSGESVVGGIIIGAIIGGMVSLNMNKENINGYGDMFACFGMGALAGGLSGGAGALVGGVAGGFVGGMLSGAVGGSVGSSATAWMSGASFGEGLLSGLVGGAFGALTGGLMGGISSASKGGSFWTGATVLGESFTSSSGSKVTYDKKAREIMDKQASIDAYDIYGVKKGDYGFKGVTTSLDSDAMKLGYTESNNIFVNGQNKKVAGFAIGYDDATSRVYISPEVAANRIYFKGIYDVRTGRIQLPKLSLYYEMVLGHELIHVENWFSGGTLLPRADYVKYSEHAAYSFSKAMYIGNKSAINSLNNIMKINGYTTPYEPFRNTSIFQY